MSSREASCRRIISAKFGQLDSVGGLVFPQLIDLTFECLAIQSRPYRYGNDSHDQHHNDDCHVPNLSSRVRLPSQFRRMAATFATRTLHNPAGILAPFGKFCRTTSLPVTVEWLAAASDAAQFVESEKRFGDHQGNGSGLAVARSSPTDRKPAIPRWRAFLCPSSDRADADAPMRCESRGSSFRLSALVSLILHI